MLPLRMLFLSSTSVGHQRGALRRLSKFHIFPKYPGHVVGVYEWEPVSIDWVLFSSSMATADGGARFPLVSVPFNGLLFLSHRVSLQGSALRVVPHGKHVLARVLATLRRLMGPISTLLGLHVFVIGYGVAAPASLIRCGP